MNDLPNKNLLLVGALMQNEMLLSELYLKYSALCPQDSEFWKEISKDETVHASWIKELYAKMQQGLVKLNEDRFKIEALNGFASYIKTQISRLETEQISPIQALSISMDLESSMIEQDIFKSYETDDIELVKVLEKLQKSTEYHFIEVKKLWQEER